MFRLSSQKAIPKTSSLLKFNLSLHYSKFPINSSRKFLSTSKTVKFTSPSISNYINDKSNLFQQDPKSFDQDKNVSNNENVTIQNDSALSNVIESNSLLPPNTIINIESKENSMLETTLDNKPKTPTPTFDTFDDFDLNPRLKLQIKNLTNWKTPTEIQKLSIPMALKRKSVLLSSETGQGKTAAYLLPVLNNILNYKDENASSISTQYSPKAIILVPTSQLADQIAKQANTLGKDLGISATVISGEKELEFQINHIQNTEKPDILIGTVGRMLFCLGAGETSSLMELKRLQTLKTHQLSMVIVDEVDMMMDAQNSEKFTKILNRIKNYAKKQKIQSIYSSATISDQLTQKLGNRLLVFSLNNKFKIPESIKQIAYSIDLQRKFSLLKYLIHRKGKVSLKNKKVIVFVRTIQKATRIHDNLLLSNINSLILHSELTAKEKSTVVDEFNSALPSENPTSLASSVDEKHPIVPNQETKTNDSHNKPNVKANISGNNAVVLVTTDLASRGLDFSNVDAVVNFDVPINPIDYLHRVGRTGRMGMPGMAISFVAKTEQAINLNDTRVAVRDEQKYLDRIAKFFSKNSNMVIENRKIPGPFMDKAKVYFPKPVASMSKALATGRDGSVGQRTHSQTKKPGKLDATSASTFGIFANDNKNKGTGSRKGAESQKPDTIVKVTYERAINEFQHRK
ncbi:ATP-dependent RNA helicase DBP9 [Smittium culicis]|uniref:RNA helicase n=1 Tax=Smittium culicis TaxID=133412 RepID=A0A1R1YS41_9FUNG|nr:ATP-dependent RNA helicase DBP9 [Smittium culicis]